ncbi:MAG: hypothetical protein CG441_1145 [Methylococcaceae bacterium NSM2-1]|nr:MAG: hypothetical protein CG441_1145 [Methylococcaceae bacterium NSM2-1]
MTLLFHPVHHAAYVTKKLSVYNHVVVKAKIDSSSRQFRPQPVQ